jgi:Uma2 family endonuclease
MTPTPTIEVDYPSSDGQPMAETPLHVNAIMLLHQAIEDFFQDRTDVFIASDIFWYWEEGNPDARISPDVMVVTGVVPKDLSDRRSFLSWKENNAVPAAVFEMASRGTWRDDVESKFQQYEQLRVPEYFLFDPEGLYLAPPLQGNRLEEGKFCRLPDDAVESELGFRLQAEHRVLRLIDLRTGETIPTRAEAADRANLAAEAERKRADAEKRQAKAAKRREDAAKRREDVARQQAEAAKQRAEVEKQRADALAAEVERLKKLLAGGPP